MRVRAGWVAVVVLVAGCGTAEVSEPIRQNVTMASVQADPQDSAPKISFEQNFGQVIDGDEVRYFARTNDATVYVTDQSLVMVVWEPPLDGIGPPEGSVVRITFEGADAPTFEAQEPLPGRSHYFLGSDETKWVTDVPLAARIVGRNLYPGVDLVLRGNAAGELEYDLEISANAPTSTPISLRIDGLEPPELDSKGNLRVPTRGGALVQRPPVVYQEVAGRRTPIAAKYELEGRRVRFVLGEFNRELPLTIDPSIAWSLATPQFASYQTAGLAVDGSGATIVAGTTGDVLFPVQDPLQATLAGAWDGFVSKIAPDGSTLVWSTFLGGSLNDIVQTFALSPSGRPVIAGTTFSTDLPRSNAVQAAFGGGPNDGFVATLSPSGSSLVFSSYLGGSDEENVLGVAVGPAGDTYLTGGTRSENFPVTADARDGFHANGLDAFVTRLSPSGSLVYSTFLGAQTTLIGNTMIFGSAITVDPAGAIYVGGATSRESFVLLGPVNAIQPTFGGAPWDAFVLKLSPSGTSVEFASFLGGFGADTVRRIAYADGKILVAGETASLNFPTQDGFPDPTSEYGSFLVGLAATGTPRLYSTRFPGRFISSLTPIGSVVQLCGSPAVAFLNTADFIPGLLEQESGGNGYLATIETSTAPLHLLAASKFEGGVSCTLDSTGQVYLSAPVLEPAAPGEVLRTALAVKLNDIDPLNDRYDILEDEPLHVAAPGILANDEPGVASLESQPVHAASFSMSSDGAFSYAPADDYFGLDRFRYRLATTSGTSGPVTVTISIQSVNDAPRAAPDTYELSGGTLVVDAPGVLANDFDVDVDDEGIPDRLRAVLASSPLFGTLLAFDLNGSFQYEPANGFEGTDTFEYLASDGRVFSELATVTIHVAGAGAPDTTIVDGPQGTVEERTVEFGFSSSFADASFECSLDASVFVACESPHLVGPLTFGSHGFLVRAVAQDGTVDASPAEQLFSVAPDTLLVSTPPSLSNLQQVSFEFTSTDPVASFQCALDASGFFSCVSPFTRDDLAEGAHAFAVRAVHAGNIADPTPASSAFALDRSGPSLTLVSPASGSSVATSPVTVTIASDEPAVVTASSAFAPGTALSVGPTTLLLALQPGYNSFSTFTRDALGNSSLFTFQIFLDADPPRLTFLTPTSGSSVYYSPVQVLASVDEDVTVIESSFLPAGPLSGGERTLTLALLPTGVTEFTATLQDAAGNTATYEGETAFRLTLSTERPPPPTITVPAPGTDFADRIAMVSGTTTGNAMRVRISGSNTVTVPVLEGTWSGTVSLPQGSSRIRAVALSDAGATSVETSVAVTAAGTRRITVVSGDAQLGPVGALLPQPLAVRVTTLAGMPVPGVPVTFSIVAEPVPGDGNLEGSGNTATVPTDTTGVASASLALANGENDEDGDLQPTVIEATVSELAGGPAVLSALGLLPSRAGGGGVPTELIPLGRDCRTVPGLPVGTCPLAPVGSVVPGFAVAVFDQDKRLLADADVDFIAARGTFGPAAATRIRIRTGPDGVARSGPFTLSTTIQNTEGYHVMLRQDDLAATPVQYHEVAARLAAVPSVVMGFAGYAYAGPPVSVRDVSPGSVGGAPETPAKDAIIARVEDAHGNAVANATVTYSVQPTGVAADPGARVFRSDPSASTTSRCDFVLTHRADNCAVQTLSATTFSAGTAWSQVALGKRASTGYVVRVSAGGGAFTDVVRSSVPVVGASSPGDIANVLQTSSTAAARFAIVDTENDDTDPITAVRWGVTCDELLLEGGSRVCGGTFSAARQMRKTIAFTADNGASFNPPVAVTGEQTSVDGTGRVPLAAGEVATFLVGGPSAGTSEVRISSNPTVFLQAASALPTMSVRIPPVTLRCSEAPAMVAGDFCRGVVPATSSKCQEATAATGLGIGTYIDRKNGHTENNVLVVNVLKPSIAPTAGSLVLKFTTPIVQRTSTGGPIGFYDNVPGLAPSKQPGLFTFGNVRINSSPTVGNLTLAPGDFEVAYGAGNQACIEVIAKSYKRPVPGQGQSPASPMIEFIFPDGSPSGARIGGPFQITEPNGVFNWADQVTRRKGDPPEGTRGSDGVADWVQMRAWDIYRAPPVGPFVEEAYEQPAGITIGAGEVAEVYATVSTVQSIFLNSGEYARTGPRMKQGAAHSNWTVTPTVEFNMFDPRMRTDEAAKGLFPLELSSEDPVGEEFTVRQLFFATAVHEARHAWQQTLLIQTNPPGASTYVDHEQDPDGGIVLPNLSPDNNDDGIGPNPAAVPYDCLPERAQLLGKPDRGGSSGSAAEILDTPANRDFRGGFSDAPGSGPPDRCSAISNTIPSQLRERDCIRFSAAICGDNLAAP